MILVTGATGQLGGIVVENLLKNTPANEIAVLVRDENKAADLKAKGVEIRVGSYFDEASLKTALQGIDKLLLISSNDFNDRIGQHKNVVDAAKNAGVKHIFYTGVTMKDIETSPLKPLLADHYQTEDYIKASGLTYTFLQNSLYFEVVPMFVGAGVLETGIFFPAGEGKVAFASRQDLGEATATILTTEGHENKTYSLTGSEAYSFAEIAEELSSLTGKTVAYTSPEPAAFEGMLKQFGLPEGIVLMSVLFAAGVKNDEFNLANDTLEQLLGRKTTDLKTFLKATYAV
ncbi:SDR family oxidoreductase [Emticicia sp. W12TSBA100-4]|uniref:SDR family oxidoreductase n=1 Tax=Emticicia sp. W12TSBA100-4 TaxID=3160965 RepID=UPI00330628B2